MASDLGLCRICGKPLTPRSFCTDGNPGAMHSRCYNRTCTICGKRVYSKDRHWMAHRPFHKGCFLRAWNEGRAVPQTWEEFLECRRAFWAPGGRATQILSGYFPPTENPHA